MGSDGSEDEDVLDVVEAADAVFNREARLAEELRRMVERKPELAERPYVKAKVEDREPDFAHKVPGQRRNPEGGTDG